MKKSIFLLSAVGLSIFASVGCGSGAQEMTKEQEAAIRNPKPSADYKGPSPEATAQMQKSIEDYRKKHANDVVKFK
jgi:hypothetical protein